MAFKLLLTDAHSPLGSALSHELERETFSLVSPEPGKLDWSDARSAKSFIGANRPHILINTLNSDLLSDKEIISSSKSLAKACSGTDIQVIHLSSYRVFGGENKTAYSESDKPSPVDSRGWAYLEAERAFEKWLEEYIVLRLSWVVSIEGDNLLTRFLQALSQGECVRPSTRRRGSPAFSAEVARVVVAMIKQMLYGAQNWGVMHFSSKDICTEAEFARQLVGVLKSLGHPCKEIQEISEGDDEAVASAVLSGRRCRNNFGIQVRSWRQGLTAIVRLWLQRQESQNCA